MSVFPISSTVWSRTDEGAAGQQPFQSDSALNFLKQGSDPTAEQLRARTVLDPLAAFPGSERVRGHILRALNSIFDSQPQWNRSGAEDNPAHVLIDVDYDWQLRTNAACMVGARLADYVARSGGPEAVWQNFEIHHNEAQNTYHVGPLDITDIVMSAFAARSLMLDLLRNCADLPVVASFGSARDENKFGGVRIPMFDAQEKEIFRLLAKELVALGVSMVNGGATTGSMGLCTEAGMAAIQECAAGLEESPQAKVILILLHFYGDSTEPPNMGSEGFTSKPMLTFLSRTLTLLTVGRQQEAFVVKGGLGSNEEIGAYLGKLASAASAHDFYAPLVPAGINIIGDMWLPLQEQLKIMLQLGLATAEQIERVRFYSPKDPAHVVAEIKGRVQERLARPVEGAVVDQHLIQIRNEVDRRLSKPSWSASRAPPDAGALLHQADRLYAGQLREEAIMLAQNLFESAEEHGVGGDIETPVNKALTQAHKWRDKQWKELYRFRARPAVAIFGGGKNVVSKFPQLKSVLTGVMKDAVTGSRLVVLGTLNKNDIGTVAWDAWVAEHKDCLEKGRGLPDAAMVRVPLKFGQEWWEQRAEEIDKDITIKEVVLPPFVSARHHGLGVQLVGIHECSYFFPGGLETADALFSLLVGLQLKDNVVGPHFGTKGSKVVLVNLADSSGKRFWDPTIQLLKEQLEGGTINREHLDLVTVLYFEGGEERECSAAEYLGIQEKVTAQAQ